MKTELYSVSKIFTEKLLRIPDYQRGYAWTEKQLKDYWNDIDQLKVGENHYFGVLTLESVNSEVYQKWQDDYWIIESKSYEPFYIVDGQQRITTTIILIQSILECINNDTFLNYTSPDEIRKRFIFESKDNGISRSYLFGYEVDNPSYEYLKQHIFLEKSDNQSLAQETIYTNNLQKAKDFFLSKLSELKINELEILYKKITQNLLFNIYSMSKEIDVHVSFETMNNRGKSLSHLELLKNRLIYLSTKLPNDFHEKDKLRKSINECWKTIYHQLGRNKDNPLDDDTFLFHHFMLFFSDDLKGRIFLNGEYEVYIRRYKAIYHKEYLLENIFTIKSISQDDNSLINIRYLYNYVSSLKSSVEIWYEIFNPDHSNRSYDIKFWLKKINRIASMNRYGDKVYLTLIMSVLSKKVGDEKVVIFFTALESLLFTFNFIGTYYIDFDENIFEDLAYKFSNETFDIDKVTSKINDKKNELIQLRISSNKDFKMPKGADFYNWHFLRYFLYEYEEYLKGSSKTNRDKVAWENLLTNDKDYKTIEHIYPQRGRDNYWKQRFDKYTDKEKTLLRHTIGNLVLLSKGKNSSLSNKPFPDKIGNDKNTVGYRYGSYSENELTAHEEWTAQEILIRGVKLIKFISKKWKIPLGDTNDIIRFLQLDFVLKKENLEVKNGKIMKK